ncbi:Pal1 cell morphology protein-domain-containing protein [Chaetomidium leptoderma]|uniref:Pal1 cell morphology protein-domain-containing protein n=1 Tax=Chaetomidium leptoderma TaxID=669021 RepID=A0AAN6ZZX8_9PEZI|nr:Pal1 cell morphology protein-domain-containing protein [Chaetomidium leptoderma]
MADSQAGQQDQRSSGLLLNLPSNNPFRNRAVSPTTAQSPTSPFDDPPPRPLSRNPFLDPAVTGRSSLSNIRSASETMSLEKRPSLTAEEIFGSLTLGDAASKSAAPPRPNAEKPPVPTTGHRGPPPPYREGGAPPPNRRGPPPNHRPTRSQEEALRARRKQESGDRGGRPDPARSPQRRQERRPRRNSESSIMDADKITTEEETKQREQRRRERERRHRENKDKKPGSRKLDIIDQLDATSIYGIGVFHHDGPFDALNPHRNRQGSRRAPMQAFPEGSLNNTLGGSGPLNVRPDHATFMGQQDDEAFKEWSKGSKDRSGGDPSVSHKGLPPVFDPLGRGNILHGDESLGLGTSTFLEGTPAARTAIQKREEERAAEVMNDGLQRKKSLAHRIRNMNRGGGRELQPSGRITNPDTGYGSRRSPSHSGPASAALSEGNPFFNEYGSGKGEDDFMVRKTDTNGSRESPTSPRSVPGLERRSTTDATGGEDPPPKASGILGRMKSLKGRRQRPGPAGADADAPPAPGTAV